MSIVPATAKSEDDSKNPSGAKGGFFRFKSSVDEREMERLAIDLSSALNMEISAHDIGQAQEKVRAYVASMKGRVGEGIDDLLALWFVRRAATLAAISGKSSSKRRHVVNSFEIGALFGGSGGTTLMAISDLKVSHRLVVIDPLDGYYGQPIDPVTGASVDVETLSHNLQLAGGRPADYQILQGRSEEPEIISKASRLKYASGYIDGDHTLLGIHNDWFMYTPRIMVGGYCIVDNYDDPTSVEVSHFMDNVVLADLKDYWTPVFKLGQTIILRKEKEVPSALHERMANSINLKAVRANVHWLSARAETALKNSEERRLQVRNRETKIERIEGELERLRAERDLTAERAREDAAAPLSKRIVDLEKEALARSAELEALKELRSKDLAALEEARQELRGLQAELNGKQGELSEKATKLALAEAEVETLTSSEEALRTSLQTAQGDIDALRTKLHGSEVECAKYGERLAARERELETVRESEARSEAARKQAVAKAEGLDGRVRDQDGLIRELQFKVQQAAYEAEQLAETRAELDQARREVERAERELEGLREQIQQSETRYAEDLELRDNLRIEKLTAELDRAQTAIGELEQAERDNIEVLRRKDAEVSRARERISMLLGAEDERLAEKQAMIAELERERARGAALEQSVAEAEARARNAAAANDRAAKAEQDASFVRAQLDKVTQARVGDAMRASELRELATHLESRVHKLEAETQAPRVLLRRLMKSIVVRTLEGSASIAPGALRRSLTNMAQDVRSLSSSASRKVSSDAPAFQLPAPIPVAVPSIPEPPEPHPAGPAQHDTTFFVNYTFGGKTRYLPRADFIDQTHRAAEALQKLRGIFKGERCFVMGNGPSLNHQNLRQLRSEFTLGANYIYMNKDKMGFAPTIISFSNFLVISQRLQEIVNLDSQIALPFYLFDEFGSPKNAMLLNMQHQTPEFSTDATSFVSTQSTVTYVNLQLAYHLGFDEVYLIGVDNRYVQPERGKEGTVLTQEEDDPNHFTPAYFKGLKWQKGDVDRIEQLYAIAGQAFKERGSKIVDCTYNGALTVFEKDDLDRVLRRKAAPPADTVKETNRIMKSIGQRDPSLDVKKLTITVSPDLMDQFGHHFNMDSYLRQRAMSKGERFISICSSKVEQRLVDQNNWLVPAFGAKTWWSIRDRGVIDRKCTEFANDLRKAMAVIDKGFGADTPATFYMYTGNLYLGLAMRDALAYRKNTTIVLQDFYAPFFDLDDPGILAETKALLEELIASGVRVAVGTRQLVDQIRQKTGLKLELIAGDPSTTYTDDWVMHQIDADEQPIVPDGARYRVFFPPNMNLEKGYLTGLRAAELIAADPELSQRLLPVVRYVPRENTDPEALALADELRAKGQIEFAEGVLDDLAFRALSESADIVAIPYTVKAFQRRMSNSLTDALYGGKPVVGAHNTYVGDYIDEYGCGRTFADGDPRDLVRAIREVADDFDRFARSSRAARRQHFKTRSWDAIYTAIQGRGRR